MLRADAARRLGDEGNDPTATEVLANIDAMTFAIEAAQREEISLALLLETHRRLLASTRLDEYAGSLRHQQNWIGGSGYNPCSASFVPPPPERVEALMLDLCAFCNGDALPAIAQAAIAHAQFESIHPFVDGNGRIGRALVQMVLRRRKLTTAVMPPVSLVLATDPRSYISGLTHTRYVGAPSGQAAHEGMNAWIGIFSSACLRAVRDAEAFEQRIASIQERWHAKIGPSRADSAVRLLVAALPGSPIVSVSSAAQLIGRTYPSANDAIGRLVATGILTQVAIGRKRNRVFEARDIVNAFADFERRGATPPEAGGCDRRGARRRALARPRAFRV